MAGQSPADFPLAFSHKVGVLFQNDTLATNRTVLGNLKFQAHLRGRSSSAADEILTLIGLTEQADYQVEKLSNGQRRLLSLGLILLHKPQVLLLAEPFARCDEASISQLTQRIAHYAADGGTVLILAESETHLTELCHEIITLDQGRIIARRNPQKGRLGTAQTLKIELNLHDETTLVSPSSIIFATLNEGGAKLVTTEGALYSSESLDDLEGRLIPWGFFRTDDNFLVNLQHAKEIIPISAGQSSIRMDDREGTVIPLSKAVAKALRALLNL